MNIYNENESYEISLYMILIYYKKLYYIILYINIMLFANESVSLTPKILKIDVLYTYVILFPFP